MNDEAILNGFMDGFAKTAEAAGFRGEAVRELLELGVCLAQREGHADAFDAGFQAALRGA